MAAPCLHQAFWIQLIGSGCWPARPKSRAISIHLDPSQFPQADGRVVADLHRDHSRIAWLHQRHLELRPWLVCLSSASRGLVWNCPNEHLESRPAVWLTLPISSVGGRCCSMPTALLWTLVMDLKSALPARPPSRGPSMLKAMHDLHHSHGSTPADSRSRA